MRKKRAVSATAFFSCVKVSVPEQNARFFYGWMNRNRKLPVWLCGIPRHASFPSYSFCIPVVLLADYLFSLLRSYRRNMGQIWETHGTDMGMGTRYRKGERAYIRYSFAIPLSFLLHAYCLGVPVGVPVCAFWVSSFPLPYSFLLQYPFLLSSFLLPCILSSPLDTDTQNTPRYAITRIWESASVDNPGFAANPPPKWLWRAQRVLSLLCTQKKHTAFREKEWLRRKQKRGKERGVLF